MKTKSIIEKVEVQKRGEIYFVYPTRMKRIFEIATKIALQIECPPERLVDLRSRQIEEDLTSDLQDGKTRINSVFEIRIRHGRIEVQNLNGRGVADYENQLIELFENINQINGLIKNINKN